MTKNMNRRDFLSFIFSTALTITMCPEDLFASVNKKIKKSDIKALDFYNLHTEERLSVIYWKNGNYIPSALNKINYILRDHRTNSIKKIDVKLIDLLYEVRKGLKIKEPFKIISGYRSPQTNMLLAMQSEGVAKKSYHIEGKAVDISLETVSIRKIRDYALKLEKGGVGYYPESKFVHLDVGPFRFWG